MYCLMKNLQTYFLYKMGMAVNFEIMVFCKIKDKKEEKEKETCAAGTFRLDP